jgi:radical SAM protein with 4Fe4S-binding SPASM domain
MHINCSVLGKDTPLTPDTVPVISPYWRLKRSGDWIVLSKYEPEQISYSVLTPVMGATLSLMNGRLNLRHLSMVVQYAHDFDTLAASQDFVTRVIDAVNKDNDAIVNMSEEVAPYVQNLEPLQLVSPGLHNAGQRRPARPLSLNLMFSNNCQTNCIYCYAQRRHIPPSRQLSTERWLELFREAQSLGIEIVTLSGGDPLFRKDALSLLAELIKLKMLFLLSTKCHIAADKADRLVDIGLTSPVNQYIREIQLSMDGPDDKTADVLAGSPGYFQRAIESVRNLVARGFNLRVKAVVIPLNAPRVYEWIKLLAGLGVRQMSVAAYNRSFYRHTDGLFLTGDDRALIAEQCSRAKADFPDIELRMTGLEAAPERRALIQLTHIDKVAVVSTETRRRPQDKAQRWKSRAHCSGGRSSMTVTPDGKVTLCDTIPQEGHFVVGDLTSQSIMDVWNSERLLDFVYPRRDRFAGSACYDCAQRTECQGGAGYCFRDTYFHYGTAYGPPPSCPLAPDDGMRME